MLISWTNIVKNIDKIKYVYSGYGVTFHGTGLWKFGDDFARNVAFFTVDSSLPSHTDYRKYTVLVLGDVPTDDINGSIKTAEEHFSINFIKAKTTFCLSLHYICDSRYLFVNGKKICKFKAE